MIRDIKFRAWTNNVIVTSDWYGSLESFFADCKDCKLMQYTGLKDKNL